MNIKNIFKGGFRLKARVLSVITAAAMIMSAVPVFADETAEPEANIVTLAAAGEVVATGNYGSGGVNDSSITYTLTTNEDGETYTLTFTGSGDMMDYTAASGDLYYRNIPWYSSYQNLITDVVIGEGITSVGDCVCFRCGKLKNVSIPNTVTKIGAHAFRNSGLESITIPNSVTAIGEYAFYQCYYLTGITIPSSVKTISTRAFYQAGLTSITIPDSVTSLGAYAFYKCASLESVVIGNGLTTIANETFCGCTSLTTITIGTGVTSISGSAFIIETGSTEKLTSITTVYIYQSATNSTLKSNLSTLLTNATIYYVSENVTLSLEQVYTDESDPTTAIPGKYNIVLTGVDSVGDSGVIYRFSSAQMKFEFDGSCDIAKIGALDIEAAENIKMVYQGNGEYAFYADPDDDNEDSITSHEIILGTTTINGVGSFKLGFADSYTTEAHGSYLSSGIAYDFKYSGKSDFTSGDSGELYFGGAVTGTMDLESTKLTIQILFPNDAANTAAAYQDMKVEIDNMVIGDETITLGTPADDDTAVGKSDRDGTTVTYDIIDGTGYHGYTIVTEIAKGYTANIKFTGAGYRTCNTSIVPSDDEATLNVWNNVMEDATTVVSGGTGTGSLQTTFLAGDIGDDGIINIYDLSAALSYFGMETETSAASKYSAYDLNRDGVIDSKDVAMVLVSYGK